MARHELFHPDHEYLGQVLIDFENAVGGERIHPLLEKHGLGDIDAEVWYPAQRFMDVMNDLQDSGMADMLDFVSIGLKHVEQAIMPPEFAALSLVEILSGMDAAYHLNNRGTDIGEIKCEIVSNRHVKMLVRVPQPDDVWYGICYGYVRRHAPEGTTFTVYYDEDAPRRHEGGDHTIIHITWE